jgi:drug/metabolite transporter (DMT)-like permease
MLLGTAFITANDALIKLVVIDHPIGEAIFIRGMFALIPIGLLLRRAGGWRAARWHSFTGQLISALLLVLSLYLFVYCLSILPLGLLTIVLYTSPLMVALLAPWLLKEQVGWLRWVAIIFGFAGTLIVLQPGHADFDWRLVLPLLVALASAYRDTFIRRLVARETSVSVLLFSSMFVTLSALPTAFLGWDPLSLIDFAVLAASGLAFGFGIFFVTDALRYADASLVVPFKYSGVVWALLLGYFLWDEILSVSTILGALIIVASGLLLARVKSEK